MGRGHWSLTSFNIAILSVNFEFKTDKAVCHTGSNQFRVFNVKRVALLFKQGAFPI